MSLDEYQRKRRFEATPEPPPKLEPNSGHRFVVQRHEATRLHYDFRLEMEGVLKSWAVPKGPSLDPDDKRLAMQVEDHPVSYFDFEGIIPEGNYGAGTVMVWDVGTWQPLSPKPVAGKYVPCTDHEAAAMLAQGDLKFRLEGKKLHGDFAIVKMKGRRPGSKGNEWLLIKKRDDQVEEGYDAENDDSSALTGRTMREIAQQHDATWVSRPAGRSGKLKAPWLADAVAKLDAKKNPSPTIAEEPEAVDRKSKDKKPVTKDNSKAIPKKSKSSPAKDPQPDLFSSVPPVSSVVQKVPPVARPMPAAVHPMLATTTDKPFNNDAWLFEIKWDGYRAIAFIENGKIRLASRNQNDLTPQYPELAEIPRHLKATTAVLDGEIVALDEQGRSSFSRMQQRSGFKSPSKRAARDPNVAVIYYAFDLLYLDGHDLRKLPLEERKQKLASLIVSNESMPNEILRYSDHYAGQGIALFEAARQKGLEGIVAKRRASIYEERRSNNWLKIKITRSIECVIGGYTKPKGSREFFGSVVLGLYNEKGQLIHVGQAGSGFDENSQREVWKELSKRETKKNPFTGKVEALREVHWVKPELVAEIKFGEWTNEGAAGKKLRAPVFLRLRPDKDPQDCVFEED